MNALPVVEAVELLPLLCRVGGGVQAAVLGVHRRQVQALHQDRPLAPDLNEGEVAEMRVGLFRTFVIRLDIPLHRVQEVLYQVTVEMR